MRIQIDLDKCCAYGFCAQVAPTMIGLDDDGKATALTDSVPADQHAAVERAARTCPQSAIAVSD